MLIILTPSISNRLRYITDLIIKKMLGMDVRLTTAAGEFNGYNGPKIVYGGKPVMNELYLEASGLLFETTVLPYEVKTKKINNIPVIFESVNPFSVLPFDPFAASFYLVSRYEEYLPHKKDSFGRFPAKESLAWQGEFLDIPIVHIWVDLLEQILKQKYPGLKTVHGEYRFTPTIDIDHAWCYRGRSPVRTLAGVVRSLMHGRFGEISDRIKVLAGMIADPYDNYSFINSLHEPYGNYPLFFILFADYGNNDNNVTLASKAFRQLIMDLDRHGMVGIHPSLSSNRHPEKLEDEYDGLCEILNREVTLSRQHFLKLTMPGTYRALLEMGITDDYSMGYASQPGFRAGISIPFPFFDLIKNESTALMIHSVSLMDVTMKDYLRLTKVESVEKINETIQTIKSVHGEFVSLWHNESLGNQGRWEGWRVVYDEMVKLASG